LASADVKLWRKAWKEHLENIWLPLPFTVCESTPAFRMLRLKVSESPWRPPGRKFAIFGRMKTSGLSVPAGLFNRASKSG
jgi:hypothetical protein